MSPSRALLWWFAAGALLCQGCATLGRLAQDPCSPSRVLEYAEHLADRTAADLEGEHRATEKAFQQTGGSCDRLRLAFQLLAPGTRFRDEARAANLLDDYLASLTADDPGLRPLAKLLVTSLRKQWGLEARCRELETRLGDERTRGDALGRQLQELKDVERRVGEERARADTLKRQLEELRDVEKRLGEEKARTSALKHQLEELKEIERLMNERQKR